MTDKPMPKCPYCGAEMKCENPCVHKRLGEPFDIYCSTFYVCRGCGATGPRTEVIIGDDDGLSAKVRECAEKAYATAMRSSMQKPLTFDELMSRPDSVWYENTILIEPMMISFNQEYSIYHNKMVVIGLYRGIALNHFRQLELPVEYYGKTWRCWARKPTDEERAAAKWEETDHD